MKKDAPARFSSRRRIWIPHKHRAKKSRRDNLRDFFTLSRQPELKNTVSRSPAKYCMSLILGQVQTIRINADSHRQHFARLDIHFRGCNSPPALEAEAFILRRMTSLFACGSPHRVWLFHFDCLPASPVAWLHVLSPVQALEVAPDVVPALVWVRPQGAAAPTLARSRGLAAGAGATLPAASASAVARVVPRAPPSVRSAGLLFRHERAALLAGMAGRVRAPVLATVAALCVHR